MALLQRSLVVRTLTLAPRGLRLRGAGLDLVRVERQHGQLGRRAANEAVDEQEVLRLLGRERRLGPFPGGRAKGERRFDLTPGAWPKGPNSAQAAGADEERLLPARLHRRREDAQLQRA